MADKTMTLNLTEREMGVLNELAERKGLSKTAVMRQALRLYQAVDRRLAAGDRLVFSGDDQMKSELLLWGSSPPSTSRAASAAHRILTTSGD